MTVPGSTTTPPSTQEDPSAASGASDTEAPIPWDLLVKAVQHYANGNTHTDKLAALVADIMPGVLHSRDFSKYFQFWQSTGFHVTPVHFYSPIPNTAELPADIWAKETVMAGIDMNDRRQLSLLAAFKRFENEYNALPQEPTDRPERFYLRNPMFGGTDALVLYCMVRHFQPRSVIEVGAGFSTRLLVEAARCNHPTEIRCIEPWPDPILKQHSLPVTLIEQRVQDVPLSLFERLENRDVLFIDSSHVLKIGGDVSHLLLEVLPRLKPGVIVHLHDIFLPRPQPREWVLDQQRFWCEQELLQAFLAFNGAFEVLLANAYLGLRHQPALREVFPHAEWWGGGSFWIRRVG
jgi:predicted O-methyltransferase YrrM